MRALLPVCFVACTDPVVVATPPQGPPPDELSGTIGQRDQADFRLDFFTADTPFAQGSRCFVWGDLRERAPRVAAIASSAPSIFSVEDGPAGDSDRTFGAHLRAHAAGDADVILLDHAGAEIDRYTIHVRPTDDLHLETPLAGEALVLAGEPLRLWIVTYTGGAVNAGAGAVTFAPTGDLTPIAASEVPWWRDGGDAIDLRAGAPGTATIRATAPDVTRDVPVRIVPASAITSVSALPASPHFDAKDGGVVEVGAFAGTAPIYGARCAWSANPGLDITLDDFWIAGLSAGEQTGAIGAKPSLVYKVSGTPGTYDATCTMPGGQSTQIQIELN